MSPPAATVHELADRLREVAELLDRAVGDAGPAPAGAAPPPRRTPARPPTSGAGRRRGGRAGGARRPARRRCLAHSCRGGGPRRGPPARAAAAPRRGGPGRTRGPHVPTTRQPSGTRSRASRPRSTRSPGVRSRATCSPTSRPPSGETARWRSGRGDPATADDVAVAGAGARRRRVLGGPRGGGSRRPAPRGGPVPRPPRRQRHRRLDRLRRPGRRSGRSPSSWPSPGASCSPRTSTTCATARPADPAHLTVLGHSYGSDHGGARRVPAPDSPPTTWCSPAAPGGRPGWTGGRHRPPDPDRVWVARNSHDPVAALGAEPVRSASARTPPPRRGAARRLRAESVDRGAWGDWRAADHTSYFDPGGESLTNLARVAPGTTDRS